MSFRRILVSTDRSDVMATRPRSGLSALLRRSQTQAVLANSRRPVLVYR